MYTFRQITFASEENLWQGCLRIPCLQSGGESGAINAFLHDLTDTLMNWCFTTLERRLQNLYTCANREMRMHCFPWELRLESRCCEIADSLFSLHMTIGLWSGDQLKEQAIRSIVWEIDSGNIVKLSDLAGKRFAATHRRYRFYLTSDGLHLYRIRKGRMVQRRNLLPKKKALCDIKEKFTS